LPSIDLGAKNDVDIRRNIYFAVANKNPEPVSCDFNVTSQGIKALAWTKVVSDSQIPLNPRGNLVTGDYELMYTVEAPFSFPGGGLIVGFGGSPPGVFADFGCEQVLVTTKCHDASGHFYARFYYKPDQTLAVLDDGGSDGLYLGGIVINTIASPPQVCVVQIMASSKVVSEFVNNPTEPSIAVLVPPATATNVPVSCQDLTSLGLAVANQKPAPVSLQITVFTHQGTALCTRGPFTLSEDGARGVVFGSDCLPE
jgi:hypothetical protein